MDKLVEHLADRHHIMINAKSTDEFIENGKYGVDDSVFILAFGQTIISGRRVYDFAATPEVTE